MKVTARTVTVSWTFDGFHHWTRAEGERRYLAERHRHRFACTVTVPVDHADRDIEFHDLLDHCTEATARARGGGGDGKPLELGPQSCEQMAERIADHVCNRWARLPWVEVSVSEDGYVTGTIRMEAT